MKSDLVYLKIGNTVFSDDFVPDAVVPKTELISNSERSLDGTMNIDIIARKVSVEASWSMLSAKNMAVLNNISNLTENVRVYKQVYSALCNWDVNVKEISYKRFSNLIRYDKSIRDKLYIYLAAAEEHLRNIIFDALEIDNVPNDVTNECLDISALRPRTDADKETDSNLYYYSYAKKFDLGLIVHIFDRFNLAQQYGLNYSDITSIRVLRNKVMHHNILLLSCFTERSNIERVITDVEVGIEALYRILPTKELREGSVRDGKLVGGLTQAINKSNYPNGDISNTPYDNVISLHKFANGGFIR